MDFSKFTEEDFDPKAWINDCFNSLDNGSGNDSGNPITGRASGSTITPAEQFAGTGIMKLQLSIQELSSSLEDSCQQMLQNIPRIVRELDAVQQVGLTVTLEVNVLEDLSWLMVVTIITVDLNRFIGEQNSSRSNEVG